MVFLAIRFPSNDLTYGQPQPSMLFPIPFPDAAPSQFDVVNLVLAVVAYEKDRGVTSKLWRLHSLEKHFYSIQFASVRVVTSGSLTFIWIMLTEIY